MALDRMETGDLQKWENPGEDSVEGQLHSYEVVNLSQGDANKYVVRTKTGKIPFFATGDLHNKLSEREIGDVVKITYEEETTTNSGNTWKVFEVLAGEPTQENLADVGLESDMSKVGDDDESEDDDDIDVDF